MLAQVYGVEVPNISYHLRKLFQDAELDKNLVIKEILITAQVLQVQLLRKGLL